MNYTCIDGRYRDTVYGRNFTDERERVTTRILGLVTWGNWNQDANYGVEFAVSF